MTALDAAFWNLERTGQLLHVGGAYTCEGTLDFERLVDDLRARLHLVPRYTQRAVPVPLALAHPTWEPDPDFDIGNHVGRHVLRPPGDHAQLVSLIGRLFAQPLDRRRPLWEFHQIDGYQGDRSVLFSKVHHCMIDGVSGVQIMSVVFDVTPTPPPVAPPPPAPRLSPLPSPMTQLARAFDDEAHTAVERVRGVRALVAEPARAAAEIVRTVGSLATLSRVFLEGVPPTPFNGHVSVLRRVVWQTLDLNAVKAVKNRLGGTVNDVVLATISAALRAYLEAHGVDPDGMELKALVPVNLRTTQEHLKLGNRVSSVVAPLPVGIFDPLERLRQVRAAMRQLKRAGESEQMSRVLDLMALLPPAVQRPLGWLQVQSAPVNTICTNVPGPPVSLYVQGKRLETLVPIVPLAQGVGLAFAILSYADTITIGLTLDPALVHDGDAICDLLQAGFDELRALAGIDRPPRRPSLAGAGPEPRIEPRPIRVA